MQNEIDDESTDVVKQSPSIFNVEIPCNNHPIPTDKGNSRVVLSNMFDVQRYVTNVKYSDFKQ